MPEIHTQQNIKTPMTTKNSLRSKSIEKINLQNAKNTYINNNKIVQMIHQLLHILLKNIFLQEQYILKIIQKIYLNLE